MSSNWPDQLCFWWWKKSSWKVYILILAGKEIWFWFLPSFHACYNLTESRDPVLHESIQEAPIHTTLATYLKSSVLGALSIFSKKSHQVSNLPEWLKQILQEPKTNQQTPNPPKLLPGNKRLTYLMYFGPASAIILGIELSRSEEVVWLAKEMLMLTWKLSLTLKEAAPVKDHSSFWSGFLRMSGLCSLAVSVYPSSQQFGGVLAVSPNLVREVEILKILWSYRFH